MLWDTRTCFHGHFAWVRNPLSQFFIHCTTDTYTQAGPERTACSRVPAHRSVPFAASGAPSLPLFPPSLQWQQIYLCCISPALSYQTEGGEGSYWSFSPILKRRWGGKKRKSKKGKADKERLNQTTEQQRRKTRWKTAIVFWTPAKWRIETREAQWEDQGMKGRDGEKQKGYISLKMARKNKGEKRQEWKPLMLAGNVVILKMKQLVGKEIGKKIPLCIF